MPAANPTTIAPPMVDGLIVNSLPVEAVTLMSGVVSGPFGVRGEALSPLPVALFAGLVFLVAEDRALRLSVIVSP
jgi:hypothetical protein